MVKKRIHHQGMTLVEIMIVVAILGIMFRVGPQILTNVTRFYRLNSARIETTRDARDSLAQINKMLRQTVSSTIVISREANQPPYSNLTARTVDGREIKYFQSGTNLNFMADGSTRTISRNLRYLGFTYPRTDDPSIISVAVTFEKGTYEGQSKAIQMAIEKVRIMN